MLTPWLIDSLWKGVASVGLPGVLAVGMMALLYQGLGILRGIQATLQDMHKALQDCACPLSKQPYLYKEITDGKRDSAHSSVHSPVGI